MTSFETTKLTLDERLGEFGSHLDGLRTHQKRLAALVNSSITERHSQSDTAMTDSDYSEMQGEILVIDGLIETINERFLGIPSAATRPSKSGCMFSPHERRTDPGFRRLQTNFQQLTKHAAIAVTKADAIINGRELPASMQPKRGSTPEAQPQSRRAPSKERTDAPRDRSPSSGKPQPPRFGKTTKPEFDPRSEAGEVQLQQDQLQLLDGSSDMSLDEKLEQEKRREIEAIAREAEELRSLREEMDRRVMEQQEGLNNMEDNADSANQTIEQGRDQLIKASKYKVAGVWIGGALLGALIGGPVGMLAGAKTAGAVVGCAAAGTAVGGITGRTFGNSVHKHNSDYQTLPTEMASTKDRRPKGDGATYTAKSSPPPKAVPSPAPAEPQPSDGSTRSTKNVKLE